MIAFVRPNGDALIDGVVRTHSPNALPASTTPQHSVPEQLARLLQFVRDRLAASREVS